MNGPGQRKWFLVEQSRLNGLRQALGGARLKVVESRNNKFVLAVAERAEEKSTIEAQPEKPLRAGLLSLDTRTRKACVGQRELALSRTEFNLLALFLRSPGRVFERSQILDAVWGSDVVVGDRTVDVHVKALRRKLEEAGGDARVLETVRGVGYRLRDG
ncbi:MAG: winged helix-turn-helix transcriptional regulator [Deltaproteobacteria bacterium]|nr:MAG: winged helix-turn-helix transcriptional regulator [Deltaproteobacteria bacterium]